MEPNLQNFSSKFNSKFIMTEKADQLKDSLKIAVKRRGNLRRMFTNEGKKLAPIFNKVDIADIVDEDIEQLKAGQQKLLDVRPEMRQLDKEIQNLHVILGEEDTADQDFVDADNISDTHSALLRQIEKLLLRDQQLQSSKSIPHAGVSKQLKHSALKLPKMSLPIFDGDRRKWLSFWDVFKSEVHDVKDISKVTKFNFLKGQLSEQVKTRVEGIMATEDNYDLLVDTLQDNYGDKTAIKNAHCVALVTMVKPQHTASALRTFYDSLMSDMRSLATLDLPTTRYGDFYVPILLEKLPEKLLTNVLKEYPCANPTIDQLILMIHNEVKRLEQVAYISNNSQPCKPKPPPPPKPPMPKVPPFNGVLSETVPSGTATALPAAVTPSDKSKSKKFKQFNRSKKVPCRFCEPTSTHNTFQCELSIQDRISAVKSKQLCFNCLKGGHATTQCQSQFRCSVCRQPHHTTLHGASGLPSTLTSPPASVSMHAAPASENTQHGEPITTPTLQSSFASHNSENGVNPNETLYSCPSEYNTVTSSHSQPNPIILKTAVTSVNNGEITKTANIFIDEGSSLSYITTQLAKELCIKPHCSKTVHINTFGGATSNNTYPVGSVNIVTDEGAISVDTLIKDVIITPIDRTSWADSLKSPHITSLQLADDFSQTQFPVQILIGLDAVWQFLKPDVIYGYPTAQASSLGYLISGRLVPTTDSTNDSQTTSQCLAAGHSLDSFPFDDSEWYSYTRAKDLEVHHKVADFLKIETLGIEDPRDTSQEDDFLERFQSQITYRDGTYFVPLPWLDNHPPLPSNFNLAHSRLQQVKKRLLKLDLWKSYASIIADQIDKGYVEAVPASENSLSKRDAHYLSHFFVLRPESETTPVRVVFAANAGHVSLNDCLYTGPCLLKSLNTIIHRFRANKYAFVADIEKAFMRIKINEEDRNYVRFLWFEDGDPDKPINVYRYTSVFFGGTSSPFILNSTILHHLSKYEKDQDPVVQCVAQDLEEKLYCDNVLTGTDDEDTAIQYYNISRQVMKDADMNLRQWFTNSPELTIIIDKMRTGSERDHASLLGMMWNPKEDTLHFPRKTIVIPPDVKFTKRQVLSSASSTFDPIGLISPVLVPAKKFISSLWDKGFDWDEILPDELLQSALWQRGPPWLTDHSLWPRWSPKSFAEDDVVSATAVDSLVHGKHSNPGSLQDLIDISRFQSYDSMLRTMSYVLRFISSLKRAYDKSRGSRQCPSVIDSVIPVPTAAEISQSEVVLLRAHQIQHFRQERDYLCSKQSRPTRQHVKPRPQLVRQLNLKLNTDGLLVAPGRLEHAMLEQDAREPILIAKKSQFTTLLVRSVHERQLHAGVRDTVVALRKRFWLPSARSEIARVLKHCVKCRYQIGGAYKLPHSPPLPDFRLNKVKPFSTVGMDFTGHLMVKNGNKTEKCYVCLFTCSTTRNVNLEIVDDMTTDQFLLAFRRHCAIYGTPSLILCDNAKTFQKGDEEIQKLFQVIEDQTVQHHFAQKRVQMRHIPAKSPHWGGMYERLIGVVKLSIKKVLRRALVSLPELQTLIKEIQAVVNDRPITFVYHDVNDPEPLTPSKLLYGFDVTALPHPVVDPNELEDENFNEHDQLNKAFKRRSLLFQHFVQRFKSEYFASLRERHVYQSKRGSQGEIIKVGDVVLMHAENVPRSSWKLAIVKKVLRGSDGLVRAAEIKTNSGVTNRSIHLLYPLEVTLTDPKEHFTGTELQIPQVETLRRSKRIASRPRPQYVESGD